MPFFQATLMVLQVPCAARLFRYLGLDALRRFKDWAATAQWTRHDWVRAEVPGEVRGWSMGGKISDIRLAWWWSKYIIDFCVFVGLNNGSKSAQSCKGPPSQDPTCSWLFVTSKREVLDWVEGAFHILHETPAFASLEASFLGSDVRKNGLDKRQLAELEKYVVLLKNVSVSCMIFSMSILLCINFRPTSRVHFGELIYSLASPCPQAFQAMSEDQPEIPFAARLEVRRSCQLLAAPSDFSSIFESWCF